MRYLISVLISIGNPLIATLSFYCSSGIGKETALDLAKRGAKIIICARNQTKCEEVCIEYKQVTYAKKIKMF